MSSTHEEENTKIELIDLTIDDNDMLTIIEPEQSQNNKKNSSSSGQREHLYSLPCQSIEIRNSFDTPSYHNSTAMNQSQSESMF